MEHRFQRQLRQITHTCHLALVSASWAELLCLFKCSLGRAQPQQRMSAAAWLRLLAPRLHGWPVPSAFRLPQHSSVWPPMHPLPEQGEGQLHTPGMCNTHELSTRAVPLSLGAHRTCCPILYFQHAVTCCCTFHCLLCCTVVLQTTSRALEDKEACIFSPPFQ